MNEKTFAINNDERADWALQKIKENKEEIAEKVELAEKRIYQIEKWLESETKTLENNIDHLEGMLAEYAREIKNSDPDFKTKKLPFGKIQYRSQRPKWHYKDDLLEYAEENMPDIIKVQKQVDKRKLKKCCDVVNGKVINKNTGEIMNCIEVKEREEKFSIKVD